MSQNESFDPQEAADRIFKIASQIANDRDRAEQRISALRAEITVKDFELSEAKKKVADLAPSIERLTTLLAAAEKRADEYAAQNTHLIKKVGELLEHEANAFAGEPIVLGTETPLLRAAQASHVVLSGNAADKRAYLRARGWKLGQLGWTSEHQPDFMPEDIAVKQQALRDVKPFAFMAIKE